MAKDDRFTVIVVVLVTLLTAGAFFWSHWGSPAIRVRPVSVADSASTATNHEPAPARPGPEQENPFVPALYEIDPATAEPVIQASNRTGSVSGQAIVILEGIATGWAKSGVPSAAEVLVRNDRDGRLVVASGTHRRYKGLRRDVQNLALSDIDSALLQADGTSLRTNLIDALDAALAVDLPDTEPDMVAGMHAWQFADTEYRSLPSAQKHLLLMGRDNARAVHAKLVEIRRYLGQPERVDADQSVTRAEPVVIAQSLPLRDPIDELIEP